MNAERTLHTGQLEKQEFLFVDNRVRFFYLSDSALLYFDRFHETIHS